ncbi:MULTISPECIES: hypothetical protein [Nocardia]|uniref:hypothetical protein n=1 Tax=Nocardia TaxID=1817 RepID=UPI002457A8AA|nr:MULTISPECIES: hypothetical protein [Nocardia]
MEINDLVKVAIQPRRSPDDADPPWRIVEVTYGSLDHVDAIGEEIYALLSAENRDHNGYLANIAIMVSPDVPGYPAGCSIHTENRADAAHYHDRYRQAWREHWNCQHRLFGLAGVDPDRPRTAEDLATAIFNREPDAIGEWHAEKPHYQYMWLINDAQFHVWQGDDPHTESGDDVRWSLTNQDHPLSERINTDINIAADHVRRAAELDRDLDDPAPLTPGMWWTASVRDADDPHEDPFFDDGATTFDDVHDKLTTYLRTLGAVTVATWTETHEGAEGYGYDVLIDGKPIATAVIRSEQVDDLPEPTTPDPAAACDAPTARADTSAPAGGHDA